MAMAMGMATAMAGWLQAVLPLSFVPCAATQPPSCVVAGAPVPAPVRASAAGWRGQWGTAGQGQPAERAGPVGPHATGLRNAHAGKVRGRGQACSACAPVLARWRCGACVLLKVQACKTVL